MQPTPTRPALRGPRMVCVLPDLNWCQRFDALLAGAQRLKEIVTHFAKSTPNSACGWRKTRRKASR